MKAASVACVSEISLFLLHVNRSALTRWPCALKLTTSLSTSWRRASNSSDCIRSTSRTCPINSRWDTETTTEAAVQTSTVLSHGWPDGPDLLWFSSFFFLTTFSEHSWRPWCRWCVRVWRCSSLSALAQNYIIFYFHYKKLQLYWLENTIQTGSKDYLSLFSPAICIFSRK